MGRIARRFLDISDREVSAGKRGFHQARPAVMEQLGQVAATFVAGYRAALESNGPGWPSRLARRLVRISAERRGFAFEGASMALTLLDLMTPGRLRRLERFIDGVGERHVYLAHVGAGWAAARCRWRLPRILRTLDPVLCWLALDGLGFHSEYFDRPPRVLARPVPGYLRGYQTRAFDQGVGRGLWFSESAEIDRIAWRIASFPESRRPDLWSGVGLACAYAGGRGPEEIAELGIRAGARRDHLAQGIAFAAQAREHAGNPAPCTERACLAIWGVPARSAAAIAESSHTASATSAEPAYEEWRARIRRAFRASRRKKETCIDSPISSCA